MSSRKEPVQFAIRRKLGKKSYYLRKYKGGFIMVFLPWSATLYPTVKAATGAVQDAQYTSWSGELEVVAAIVEHPNGLNTHRVRILSIEALLEERTAERDAAEMGLSEEVEGCIHPWHCADCPSCGRAWEDTAAAAGWRRPPSVAAPREQEPDAHQPVHNHGPEDGPGIRCPETLLPNGSLRGACMQEPPAPAEKPEFPCG